MTLQQSSNIFDTLRKVRADGSEYWSARDLQPLLGYAEWRKFSEAIERAMRACENSGQDSRDHFVPAAKMVELGSKAEREVLDHHLTRYACYLVAMNGDPRKDEIALAQTYFAVKTHQAEQVERAASAFAADPVLAQLEIIAAMRRQQMALEERTNALEEVVSSAPIRSNSSLRAQVHAACQRFGKVHPRSFGGAYRAFKEAFGFHGTPLASYDDLPQSRAEEALNWLELQIRTFSAQRDIFGSDD